MIRNGLKNNRLRLILTTILLLISFFPVSGLTWPDGIRVGVSELIGKDLSPAGEYLSRNLSLEILKMTFLCDTHVFGFSEREAFIEKSRGNELDLIQKKIGAARAKKDLLFFKEDSTPEERIKLEEEIRTLLEDADKVRTSGFSKKAPEILPILPSSENSQGKLLPGVSGGPDYFGQKDLDLLVWGRMEEVEGLVLLTCGIYSYWEDKEIFGYSRAVLPESSEELIRGLAGPLRETLLGRPWADLTVSLADDIPGEIILDGDESGGPRLKAVNLEPGEHIVKAQAAGYVSRTDRITLESGAQETLEIRLEPLGQTRLPIRSYPQGADIYLDSQWAGQTPLIIDIPPRLTRILLRKEGYNDYTYYVSSDGRKAVEVNLNEENNRRETYVKRQRDRYYSSLGAFFLSIPLSVVLYSAYTQYGQALREEYTSYGETDEFNRLYSLGNLSYYGYLGALSINGICLVNLILDAVSYVRAAGQDFKE